MLYLNSAGCADLGLFILFLALTVASRLKIMTNGHHPNKSSACAALGIFPTVLHFDPQNQYQNISY